VRPGAKQGSWLKPCIGIADCANVQWRLTSVVIVALILATAVNAGVRPADQKLAKQAALRVSDLSGGAGAWTEQSVPSTPLALRNEPRCKLTRRGLLTGFSSSPYFWSQAQSRGQTAESATYVLGSVAGARSLARWFLGAYFVSCIRTSIGQRLNTTAVTSAPLTIHIRCTVPHGRCPFVAVARRFHSIVSTNTVNPLDGSMNAGNPLDEYNDLVVLRRARGVVVFVFGSGTNAYDARDEAVVVQRVAARLE
jgi:hypothetical protein